MTGGELAVVALVALAAGGVNAVAGGGSLLLFPALVATGLGPLAANVTNSVALWPGYAGAVAGLHEELRTQRAHALALSGTALAGGAAGAGLLLVTGEGAFEAVVPVLVLAASGLLALQPQVARRVSRLRGTGRRGPAVLLHALVLAAGVYGGYFGALLGVVLLAVLGVLLGGALPALAALRSLLSLVVSTVALVAFALLGPVEWAAVAVGAPAALLGGWAGARLLRRLPGDVVRWAVAVAGAVAGVALL